MCKFILGVALLLVLIWWIDQIRVVRFQVSATSLSQLTFGPRKVAFRVIILLCELGFYTIVLLDAMN